MGDPLSGLPMLATPKQAAEIMGPTEAQVRGLIRAGRIAHVMVGTRRMIPAQQLKISSRKTRCCPRRLTGDTFAHIANPQLCSARALKRRRVR
jgi:excisionase family DNA binding protein